MRQIASRIYTIILLAAIYGWLLPPAAFAQAPSGAPTTPADTRQIMTAVNQILRNVERIRVFMGKPTRVYNPLVITDAEPRHVMTLAATLYKRADHLAFEVSRVSTPLDPGLAQADPSDRNILKIVNAALAQTKAVIKALDIKGKTASPPNTGDINYTALFIALSHADQQINNLLERRFAPSDVYQQVTYAIHITGTLLAAFPNQRRIADPPPFVGGKTPSDVFHELIQCHALLLKIGEQSDLGEKLGIREAPPSDHPPHTPSEVYDVAVLLVEELSHLHHLVPGLENPRPAYYPGRVYPSHVYQRARMLHALLQRLSDAIKSDPGWIRHE